MSHSSASLFTGTFPSINKHVGDSNTQNPSPNPVPPSSYWLFSLHAFKVKVIDVIILLITPPLHQPRNWSPIPNNAGKDTHAKVSNNFLTAKSLSSLSCSRCSNWYFYPLSPPFDFENPTFSYLMLFLNHFTPLILGGLTVLFWVLLSCWLRRFQPLPWFRHLNSRRFHISFQFCFLLLLQTCILNFLLKTSMQMLPNLLQLQWFPSLCCSSHCPNSFYILSWPEAKTGINSGLFSVTSLPPPQHTHISN